MTNRTILITGATGGVGAALTKKYIKEGNKVFALGRDLKKLNDLKNIVNNKELYFPIQLDFESSTEDAFAYLSNQIGEIDVLINNAASFIKKDIRDISLEELEYIYKVNVFSPILLTKYLIKNLENGKDPQVINISSAGGVTGSVKFEEMTAYSSSKGAFTIMSECIAKDLETTGIRVNALALGAVETSMLRHAFPKVSGASAQDVSDYIYNFSVYSKVVNGVVHLITLKNP